MMTEDMMIETEVEVRPESRARDLFEKYVAKTSPFYLGLEVDAASGCYIYGKFEDERYNKKYLDFVSGISVMNLGHSNPRIREAIVKQAHLYTHSMVYGEHIQKEQVLYAKDISIRFPIGSQVFFTNSGTESNELALKMARKITGRKKFLALKGCFHGRTFGSLSVSWNDKYREGFGKLLPCDFITRNSYKEKSETDFSKYAAVIVELVQGEAGTYPLDPHWYSELIDNARNNGCLVIVDEVQTGFGRIGEFFAQHLYEAADITTLGKAMGGGLPLGGVVAKRELFELLQTPPLSHVTTFGGNPVSCAAGRAMLGQIDESLLENVRRRGEQIEVSLEGFVSEYSFVEDQRGLGLMRTLEFESPECTETFVKGCQDRGLLVGYKLNNPTCVRIAPPLIIGEGVVETALNIMKESINNISSAIN